MSEDTLRVVRDKLLKKRGMIGSEDSNGYFDGVADMYLEALRWVVRMEQSKKEEVKV